MPEDERDEEDTGWLLEPPDSGQVHVSIAIGSDVELSPEATAALERFMSTLQEAEVSGFDFSLGADAAAGCKGYRICNPYGVCQPVVRKPCLSYVHCRIAGIA
jgi:hypothetical protein